MSKVAKSVYFNTDNPKEKAILEWLNASFCGFNGIVKDALYNKMVREKAELQDSFVSTTEQENTEMENYTMFVDNSIIEDVEC